MSRLRFKIARSLVQWRGRRRRRPVGRFCTMNLRGDDDRPYGPGWFDSSWDLDQGLEVATACPGDPGFLVWIEAQAPTAGPALEPALASERLPAPQPSAPNGIDLQWDDEPAWSLPVPAAPQGKTRIDPLAWRLMPPGDARPSAPIEVPPWSLV